MGKQRVVDIPKFAVPAAERTGMHKLLHHLAETFVLLCHLARPILPGTIIFGHFFCTQTKNEHVLFPDLLRHLHVGAIHRTDRERAVHHEFHVSRTRGLLACGRNLFADIGSRYDLFGQRDGIIFKKQHFQTVLNRTILINRIGHRIDQLDDFFGKIIARRCLRSKDERARYEIIRSIVLQTIV
ncbi:hypothetical protein D1872_261400 [compost metagenome]